MGPTPFEFVGNPPNVFYCLKAGGLPRRKVGGRIANSIEGVAHDGRNASSAMRSGHEQ